MEQFESFSLPDTSLQAPMPPAAAQFIRACVKGMSRSGLLRIARNRGLQADWLSSEPRLPGIYKLHLRIDDRTVPLMVRMKSVCEAQAEAMGLAIRAAATNRSA